MNKNFIPIRGNLYFDVDIEEIYLFCILLQRWQSVSGLYLRTSFVSKTYTITDYPIANSSIQKNIFPINDCVRENIGGYFYGFNKTLMSISLMLLFLGFDK